MMKTRTLSGLVTKMLAAVASLPAMASSDEAIEAKLKSIVIPEANFQMIPLEFAMEFLQTRSVELDRSTADPAKKGVNVVMRQPEDDFPMVNLQGANIPLGDALKKIADQFSMEVRIEHSAVVIAPPKAAAAKPAAGAGDDPEGKALWERLNRIRIPAMEFQNTPLKHAVDWLGKRVIDSGAKGIEFEITAVPPKKPGSFGFPGEGPRFDLMLKDIPASDALAHICGQTGMTYRLALGKVILSPMK